MSTKKRTTRQVLSEDAQKARMEKWAAQVGLPKSTAQTMLDKYGPYAYQMMQDAMAKPMIVKQKTSGNFRSSSGCIKYFVNNTLSEAEIAKVVGTSANSVTKELSNYTQASSEPILIPIAKKADEAANHMDSRVDEHSKGKEQQQQQEIQEINNRQEKLNNKVTTRNQNKSTPKINPNTISVSSQCNRGGKGFSTTIRCNGRPIKDLPGAANDSITTTSTTREIDNRHDLIGGYGYDGNNPYYGMFQTTPDGVKNYAIYAATHPDKYGKIADQLFNKNKSGYQAALKQFQAEVKKKGYAAYTSAARAKLATYVKPEFLSKFNALGKNAAYQNSLVQLQRDYACEVAARNYGIKQVSDYLKAQGIDPLEVKPAVWGAIFAIGDARGNIDFDGKKWKPGLKGLLKGKTVDQINSPEMIDAIQKTYKTVYNPKKPNERNAINYAKTHLNEEHSIATARELSLMVGDPKLYDKYLQIVATQQGNSSPQPYKIAKGQEQKPLTPTQQMSRSEVLRG